MRHAILDETYITSDFPAISYLTARGVQLIGTRKGLTGRVEFEFEDRRTCEDLVQELSCGKDLISARRLFSAIQETKRIIFAKE